VAALSLLGDTGAALSLCAAGATAIAATVSVQRQWARLRSVLQRPGPTTSGGCGYDAYGNQVCPNGYSPY